MFLISLDNHQMARCLQNSAQVHFRAKHLEEAERLLVKAQRMLESLSLLLYHVSVLQYNDMSVCCSCVGRTNEEYVACLNSLTTVYFADPNHTERVSHSLALLLTRICSRVDCRLMLLPRKRMRFLRITWLRLILRDYELHRFLLTFRRSIITLTTLKLC